MPHFNEGTLDSYDHTLHHNCTEEMGRRNSIRHDLFKNSDHMVMITGSMAAISDENLNLKVTRTRSVLPPDGSIAKLYNANVPVSENDLLLGPDFMSFKSFPDLSWEKFMIDQEDKAVEYSVHQVPQ